MPGDEMVRQEHEDEAGLVEEREEYDLFSLPDGQVKKMPTGELRVERVGGRLVKRRGTYRNPAFPGCGHSRLAPEQEAQLIREGGQRPGFCLKCGSEWCGACRNEACKRCGEVHLSCDECQTPACRACLTIRPSECYGQPCAVRCAKCVETAKPPTAPAQKAEPATATASQEVTVHGPQVGPRIGRAIGKGAHRRHHAGVCELRRAGA